LENDFKNFGCMADLNKYFLVDFDENVRPKKHISAIFGTGAVNGALGAQLHSASAWTNTLWLQAPCSEQGFPCFVFRVLGDGLVNPYLFL